MRLFFILTAAAICSPVSPNGLFCKIFAFVSPFSLCAFEWIWGSNHRVGFLLLMLRLRRLFLGAFVLQGGQGDWDAHFVRCNSNTA